MDKLNHKLNAVGAACITCGIISMVTGLAVGILMTVNGGRLLAARKSLDE